MSTKHAPLSLLCLFCLFCLFCMACNTHVFSPPAGTFPIESAATVGAQRHSAGADVGFTTGVFGPSFTTYRASYRYGFSDQLEVSTAPSVIWVQEAGAGDSHPGIYALRGALKYAPIPHVSGAFGLGAGGSAGGPFLSPDLGLNLAWENKYLVPFGAVRTFLSAPIARRQVHFSTRDDNLDDASHRQSETHYHRIPRFSYGVQASFGLRAPLWYKRDARLRPAVNCAIGATFLYDRDGNKGGGLGGGCGFDLGFDLRFDRGPTAQGLSR